MSSEEPHSCRCRSTRRAIAVLLEGREHALPNFASIVERLASRYSEELSIVVFEIAGDTGFSSASHLRGFIETEWATSMPAAKACWIDPLVPIARQLQALGAARPLAEWAGDRPSSLSGILDEGRIETWFQPVFRRDRLRLWGYECLARARDADGELISPLELFRWAREDDLVFMLDRVCRERHIENIARVVDHEDLNYLINFLPTVIYDPKVCLRTTFEAAAKSGVRPEQVIFEVVESEKVLDHDALTRILDEYRAAGFRVALDDLGAGHAGLTLLADIGPDLIKIDRALVAGSTRSTFHRSVCQSVVDIARASERLVLAEGVETVEEYALFEQMGVDLFQGYLFGKPLPVPARHAAIEPLDFTFEPRLAG